jgi:E3 Ubiquitin ligase
MFPAPSALSVAFSTSTDAKLTFWAAVGSILGVVLFIRGFMMLRFKRLIVDTPSSKIRSASMGLVEISGMAKGPSTIPAGITGEPCYYYRALAWELRESGNNREWKQVANESLYVPFFVEDPTGRILVDPQGADLDIHRNFRDELDGSLFWSNRSMFPENVTRFLARNGISFTSSIRLEEYSIKPDFPLFVLGTLCSNPHRDTWDPAPHTGAGPSVNSRLSFLGPGLTVTLTNSTQSLTRISLVSPKPLGPTPPSAPIPPWPSVSMGGAAMSRQTTSAVQPAKLQPSPSWDGQPIGGTSVATADAHLTTEKPPTHAPDNAGFDLHPPVCIRKGSSESPFMISWQSQREIVQSLAWKSTLCIWGGPALTLSCLYFLAVILGWA